MYAKVFASLWVGTLYGKTDAQLVFIYLLAHADKEGFVRAVPEAVAGATGMSPDRVASAIDLLESPDPESNSTELDGRRLERTGSHSWQIVNYTRYRNIRDPEDRRVQNREAKRRERARVSNSQQPSADVSIGQHMSAPSAHAEADTDAEADAEADPLPAAARIAAAFGTRLLKELQTSYPLVDIEVVALKVLDSADTKNPKNALRNWVKFANDKKIDLKPKRRTFGEPHGQVRLP